MRRILYDGGLEGFLTCLAPPAETAEKDISPHLALRIKNVEVLSPEDAREGTLFSETERVLPDPGAADRFRTAVRGAWGGEALRLFEFAFRSGKPGKERILLSFLEALLDLGAGAEKNIQDPRVTEILQTCRRIRYEAHRLSGLLRFSETETGVLYASFEPDNDVLDLLSPHFRSRFPRTPWIIHDLARNRAALWDGRTLAYHSTAPEQGDAGFTPEELKIRKLWKVFFDGIDIAERRNPRLQTHFVPRRYRKHLPEFEI